MPSESVVAMLSVGPKSFSEIEDAIHAFGRRLPGDNQPLLGRRRGAGARLNSSLAQVLEWTIRDGLVSQRQDDGRYWLTEAGKKKADEVLELRRARRERVHLFLEPPNAAKFTMVLQVAITLFTVPAALISSSAAQLVDAADELLDVVAGVTVFLGVRAHRERTANVIVVIFMLVTGSLALAFAVRRFLVPVTATASWYPLTIAIASIPVYVIRSLYERSAGLHGASPVLVAQSVDSRNHAFVGVGVTAGLVAAKLGAPIVDSVVGVVVSLMILQSCAYLARDLIGSLRKGLPPGMSRYSTWIGSDLERGVQHRLESWLLFLVDAENITLRSDLILRVQAASDPDVNPLFEFGMEVDGRRLIDLALDGLVERGRLSVGDPFEITDTGRRELRKDLRWARRMRSTAGGSDDPAIEETP